MNLDDNVQNDDVVDVRGEGGGGGGFGFGGGGFRLGGGGAIVVIVVLIVARLAGVDIRGLLGGHDSPPASVGSSAHGSQDPQIRRIGAMMKDIQDTDETLFKAKGMEYRHAKLYVFTSEINTGCGESSASIGPFYCPSDEKAYIDLSFYQELRSRFGAPGEFAQAYVLAHEIGHHLQKLLGITARQQNFRGHDSHMRNEGSVRMELQADCFAGVWGHSANARGLLQAGEMEQALTAASAIGDDRLQRGAGVSVNSETWTHGSSAERVRWFRRGFDSGSLDACDTFAAPTL